MKTVMFDSMIYDKIIETPGFLELLKKRHQQGVLRILDTHIQQDQLTATPLSNSKREPLLTLYEELKPLAKRVRTSGGAWDVARWDEADFGADAENNAITKIMGPKGKHIHDALIAVTAAMHVDTLVTNESRLRNQIKSRFPNLEVLTFEGFQHVLGTY